MPSYLTSLIPVLVVYGLVTSTEAQQLLLQLDDHRLPFAVAPFTVEPHDFDRDGDLDLFFGVGWPADQLFVNDGHGHFVDETQKWFSHIQTVTRRFAFADVNRDGYEDVLSAANFALNVYLGTQQGIYQLDSSRTVPLNFAVRHDFLDIDNDGAIDLLAASTFTQSLSLLVNDGNGFFRDESSARLPATKKDVTSIASADVDGDGDLDLILAATTDTSLFLNDGKGKFADASSNLPLPRTAAGHTLFADIDGNGTPDLVLSGPLRVWLNDGKGRFTDASSLLPSKVIACTSTTVADFDENGLVDIYVARDTTDMLLLRTANGFLDASALLSSLSLPTDAMAAFDADGDEDLDVVLCHPSNRELLTNHHRHLAIGKARINNLTSIDCFASPEDASAFRVALPLIGLDAAHAPIPIPPYGRLMIDVAQAIMLPPLIIPPTLASSRVSLLVPHYPALIGRVLTSQTLVVHSLVSPYVLRLTSLAQIQITQ